MKHYTSGAQAKPKGLGDRKITTDSTVKRPIAKKVTKNGNGPRKAS